MSNILTNMKANLHPVSSRRPALKRKILAEITKALIEVQVSNIRYVFASNGKLEERFINMLTTYIKKAPEAPLETICDHVIQISNNVVSVLNTGFNRGDTSWGYNYDMELDPYVLNEKVIKKLSEGD